MAKKVIDVSVHNGYIDWKIARNYIDGAIIRCGFGDDVASQDDMRYAENVKACDELGIPYGVYLYSYAGNTQQIKSEIAHALRLCKGHNPKLGVFLDLEENRYGYIAAEATQIWCREIAKAGYKAGIYCGAYFYKQYMPEVHNKVKALWWIAGYGTNSGYPELNFKPNPGFAYDAWQYTSRAIVPGIANTVDMSEWYMDFDSDVPMPDPTPTPIKAPTIEYAVKTLHHGIREFKKNGEIAGYLNDAITGIAIRVGSGSVKYRVHLLSDRWLPWVYGCDWKDDDNGYAGIGDEVIDAIQIMYYTDTAETGGQYYYAEYCVKPAELDFLPVVIDTDESNGDGNGTAGIFGIPFTEIKISLRKC